jgi:transposase
MGLRLTRPERTELEGTLRKQRAEAREWRRARMIVLTADGESVSSIARQLGTSRSRVTEWLARFRDARLDGLADAARSGRPRVISSLERHQVVAAACQSPTAFGVARNTWTRESLAEAVVAAPRQSISTIGDEFSTRRGAASYTARARPGERRSDSAARPGPRSGGGARDLA